MIQLTRINGTVILVNEKHIELAEEAPDTVVTMVNGHRYLVRESVSEINEKILEYEKKSR